MTRRPDSLTALEDALHAKMTAQIADMDAKDVDGKPTWDAKSRNEFFKIATEYVIKKRGSGPAMGGRLGGD